MARRFLAGGLRHTLHALGRAHVEFDAVGQFAGQTRRFQRQGGIVDRNRCMRRADPQFKPGGERFTAQQAAQFDRVGAQAFASVAHLDAQRFQQRTVAYAKAQNEAAARHFLHHRGGCGAGYRHAEMDIDDPRHQFDAAGSARHLRAGHDGVVVGFRDEDSAEARVLGFARKPPQR